MTLISTLYLIIYRWLLHWLKLLEALVGILTFGFYYPRLTTPACYRVLARLERRLE